MNSFNKYIKRNVMYKLGTMILSFLLATSCIPVYAQEYEEEEYTEETSEEVIQEESIEPEEVIDNTEEYEEVIEEEIPEESGEIILEGSPPVAVDNGTTMNNPFPYGTSGSHSFRIPSLTTLSDGSLFAAADIRYNTTYNGGGLDTIVARSSDGGSNWSYRIANYLGDNGNEYNANSSAFIDPSVVVKDDEIYLLVDLYPYGIALNGSGNTPPSTQVGFNSEGKLLLSDNEHVSYDYYLDGNAIFSSDGVMRVDYCVDNEFNLYSVNDHTFTYVSNLFYSDSPFKVVRTGYLYLTKSYDYGNTWSEPILINNAKRRDEQVCLVAPGKGLVTSFGRIIFPIYKYNGSTESQVMGFLWSDDGMNWNRVDTTMSSWSSESTVIELWDGTLRFFYRNSSTYLSYVDYHWDTGWSSAVQTEVHINSNTQLSALVYSKSVEGKPVILVSAPQGPTVEGSNDSSAGARKNGKIFIGLLNEDKSISWQLDKTLSVPSTNTTDSFMYSSMSEYGDGNIAILYEDHENGWGAGEDKYYQMSFKTYTSNDFGLAFDENVIPTYEAYVDTDTGISIYQEGVTFTDFKVSSTEAPSIENTTAILAYDLVPSDINGLYKDQAMVTIPIPSDWDTSKVKAFVVNEDTTVSIIEGSVEAQGYSYSMPHFSVGGIALTAAQTNSETRTLEVGGSTTIEVDGGNYAGSYTPGPGGIANATVTGTDEIPGKAQYSTTNVKVGNVISNYTSSWTKTNYFYSPDGGKNFYPLYAQKLNRMPVDRYNWGYSATDSPNDVVFLDYQLTWWSDTSDTISGVVVYNKTTSPPTPAHTTIKFDGVSEGTSKVTIGNTEYTINVKAKSATKPITMNTGDTQPLNPLTELGLSSGKVTYDVTSGANLVSVNGNSVVAGNTAGTATVVATVKNDAGRVIGRVTYNVTVQEQFKDVKIKKVVKGNFGDVTKDFEFEVTSTKEIGSGSGYALTSDKKTATFKLKDGGEVTLKNVPSGAVLKIGEKNANDYVTDIKVGNVTVGGSGYTVTNNDNQIIVVTNTKNGIVDSGIVLDNFPYILLLLTVIAGCLLLWAGKRYKDDDS